MKSIPMIVAYIVAITLANLSVAHWGPEASVPNAFLLIGFDLYSRDYLHDLWQTRRAEKMLGLIATAGVVSYLVNPATGRIAIASTIAFTLAALADWAVYSAAKRMEWHERVNLSNIAGAGVDSVVFPALAFGFPLLWLVMIGQFSAKVAGGLVWSLVIGQARKPRPA